MIDPITIFVPGDPFASMGASQGPLSHQWQETLAACLSHYRPILHPCTLDLTFLVHAARMTPTSPFGPSIDQILVSTIAIIHTSLFSASVMGSSLILKVVASKKIANSPAEVGLTICFTSAEDSVLPFIHAGTESNFCKYCHKMMSDDSGTYLSPEDRPKFCSAHCEREYEWDENAYRARRFARNALKTIPGNSPSSNNIPQSVSPDSSDYHNALDNAIRALEDSAC